MPLSPGQRIGSYEILGPLGAGGMGEVYRARDAKLNRGVAVKVLPETLAQDPAALSRFEREAQAVAALSHPNILAIHDFGNQNGIAYAVTELLDGEVLRARLANGALPVRKAVDYGVHIVKGVAAAHARGIIHRDLKPENIFITKAGVVKILDFGLAKAVKDEPQGSGGETQIADTTPGMVLGTVGYMSPEQVRAQPVDHRSDIFSFGAVFYEMLTGQRPFRGDSHIETMNAILKEDPPEFTELNANLPGSLERIIRRCLEKQPEDRFHSAHDLAIALEAVSGSTSQSSTAAVAAVALPAPPRRVSPALAAALALAIGAAAFFAGKAMSGPAASSNVEMRRLTYRRGPIWSGRMSLDGQTFVYSAVWEGSPLQIYSVRTDSPESQALQYRNADVASLSSTGELAIIHDRIDINAYARAGTLARGSMSGAAMRDILEGVQDADWLPNGADLAVARVVDRKYQLEFPIGKVVYQTGGWISHVRVSPDGQRVAFLDQPSIGDDRGTAAIIDASGKKTTMKVECASTQGIAWTPSGSEVWFTCASAGAERAIIGGSLDGSVRAVYRVPGTLFLLDIGKDGTVLLSRDNTRFGIRGRAPGHTEERDLSWLDWGQLAQLSEDGRTVLFTEQAEGGGSGYSVYLRGTDGSPAVRLGAGNGLALSLDGKWAIAADVSTSPTQLVLMPTGAGQARKLTTDDTEHVNARFHPDGKRFVFVGFKPGQQMRGWIQSLDGGEAVPILPEGVRGGLMSTKGDRILVRAPDGSRSLYPLDPKEGPPVPVRGVEPTDGVIRFTADDRGLFLRRDGANDSVDVFRFDMATGARARMYTIVASPDTISLGGIGGIQLSADGQAYVYGYGVAQSDLYVVKGLK